MRIAFHVPRGSYLKQSRVPSGDVTNVRNLVAGLTRLGHQVSVVSHLHVRRLWRGRVPAWRLVTEALRLRREIQRSCPDAWLIYSSSITDADLFGWWQCRGRYVLVNARVGRGRRLPARWRWLFRLAHHRSLARADSVVAERPPDAEALRRAGVPAERLSLLPSPAGGLGQLPAQSEARKRLSLPDDAPVVLCITRLPPFSREDDRGKTGGVLDVLARFSELPRECTLILVGDGPGRARVEEEIDKLGITTRVRLAGSVPHEELRWFYAACDFYAYPASTNQGLVAIIEAQAAARPVVAVRTPTTETMMVDGQTALLANDLKQFGMHMAALAADRPRCASMGQTAQEYVATYHSIETRVRQIEALLLGTAHEGWHSQPDPLPVAR